MIRHLRTNLPYRILALGIALLLWTQVRRSQNPVETHDMQLSLTPINCPTHLELVKHTPRVRVTLRARRSDLAKIQTSDIKAQVDLTGALPGENQRKIKCVFPTRVEPLSVGLDPPLASVTLEEVVARSFDVQVNLEGEAASGYAVGVPSYDPPRVIVTGRRSLVSSVRIVFVKVPVSNLDTPLEGIFNAYPVDRMGIKISGLKVSPATVRVTLPVEQTEVSKDVAIRANVIGKPAPGYIKQEITVAPAITRISGKRQHIAHIESVPTEQIDISGASVTTSRFVALQPPANVKCSDTRARVTVTLRRLPAQTDNTEQPPPRTEERTN